MPVDIDLSEVKGTRVHISGTTHCAETTEHKVIVKAKQNGRLLKAWEEIKGGKTELLKALT